MRRNAIGTVLAILLAPWLGAQEAQTGTGSISGVMQDDKGNPLPNVVVTWYRSVIRPEDRQAPQGFALTDKQGQFTFTKLGAATYYLCTSSDVERSLVANCAWTRTPPSITLKTSETVANYMMTVQTGARVEFEIQDAKKTLKAPESLDNTNQLHLGLTGADGMFHAANIRSRSDNDHFYMMVVPPNVNLQLQVSGQGLKITDDKDARVDKGSAGQSFQLAPGNGPKKYKFKVDVDDGK